MMQVLQEMFNRGSNEETKQIRTIIDNWQKRNE